MIEIISLILFLVLVFFLLIKKEIIYVFVVIVVFFVSLPLVFNINVFSDKEPTTILYLDYSDSARNKVKQIEPFLTSMNFDFVRKFGIPYNKDEDIKIYGNDGNLYVIVSDFLFDVPKSIKSNTNVVFLYLEDKVYTNHLIKAIYLTNIGQIDYLSIEMIAPSDIRITNYKTKKLLFSDSKKSIYLTPLKSLSDEILISSGRTNIYYKIEQNYDIGVFWFEPNQDLRALVNTLNIMKYNYKVFSRISKDSRLKIEKRFKYLVVGYPNELNISYIINATEKGGKILVISPRESFLREIMGFSKMRNLKLTTSNFRNNLSLFSIDFSYPVKIDGFRYNFPKVSGEFLPLDKNNTVIYAKMYEREFLLILLDNISKVDIENLKVGIYSSFANDLFVESLRFLVKNTSETLGVMVLQESAFSGGIKPEGNAINVKSFSKDEFNKIKNKFSSKTIEKMEINISNWWFLLIGVILLLTVKWILSS